MPSIKRCYNLIIVHFFVQSVNLGTHVEMGSVPIHLVTDVMGLWTAMTVQMNSTVVSVS